MINAINSHHYQIRFNTKHNGSELKWRIFEDGVEHLVSAFHITVPMYSEMSVEQTPEGPVDKWNVACDGQMKIFSGRVAVISEPLKIVNSTQGFITDQDC